MHCFDSEIAVALFERRLPASEAAAVYKHAATCADCRLLLADIARPDDDDDTLAPQLVARIERRLRSWSVLGRAPFTVSRPLRQGDIVDRYLIVRRVGDAGLGAIYEAYDPELEDRVVLKLLHPDSADAAAATQLLDTARVLADVSHPNILRVYSAGTHAGQVYIAAEFVKGTPLSRMCQTALSWRETLDLFLQAARGLAAAQKAGVTHGCFTPDSCVVGQDGRVRVLDFGIAEILSAMAEERAANQPPLRAPAPEPADLATFNPEDSYMGYLPANVDADAYLDDLVLGASPKNLGQRFYVAPEQLQGEFAGAATDQFTFCASLYHALYKHAPFAGDTIASWVHEVLLGRVRPTPPDADIPNSVRAAVLRGLRRDPAERHSSMEELLNRLEGGSRSASRRKWVGIAAAAAIVLTAGGLATQTISAGTSVDTCASRQDLDLTGLWNTERKQAVRQAMVSSELLQAPQQWQALERGLDNYAKGWQATAAALCTAKAPNAATQRCVEQGRHGLQTLLVVLESTSPEVLSRSAAAVAALPDPQHCLTAGVSRYERDWARDLANAAIMHRAGDSEQAKELATQVERAARESGRAQWHALAAYQLGRIDVTTGEIADAARHLSAAVWAAQGRGYDAIATRAALQLLTLAHNPAEGEYWQRYIDANITRMGGDTALEAEFAQRMAASYARQGMFEDAANHASQAVQAYVEAAGETSPQVAEALHALGVYQLLQGAYKVALATQHRAFELYNTVYGPVHPDTAAAQVAMADVLLRMGQTKDAQAALDEAFARLKRARRGGSAQVQALVARAQALVVSSRLGRAQGRYDQAVADAERAVVEYERALGGAHPRLTDALVALGDSRLRMGQYRAAAAAFKQAMVIWEETSGGWPESGLAHARLGLAVADYGAEPRGNVPQMLSADAAEGAEPTAKETSMAWALGHIGGVLVSRGAFREALPYYERALAIWERHNKDNQKGNQARLGSALAYVGITQTALGQYERARPLLQRALEVADRFMLPETPDAQYALARILWRDSNQRDRARTLALSAHSEFTERGQGADAKTREVQAWLDQRSEDSAAQ